MRFGDGMLRVEEWLERIIGWNTSMLVKGKELSTGVVSEVSVLEFVSGDNLVMLFWSVWV